MKIKKALVCGAGGFIGSHLVKRLKSEGYWVRGVDLRYPEFSSTAADDFAIGDLRDPWVCRGIVDQHFDEVYQLAADMGGAGYVFVGDNDAEIMHNSTQINLNMLDVCTKRNVRMIFFSSSACIYPLHNQLDPNDPNTEESSAYPASPDSDYGWEKLYSERLYMAFSRNKGIQSRIGRFHNIFGPEGTWRGGREKSPAAICRKVAEARDGEAIEIWGDGQQTRSFLHIDECLEAVRRLVSSNHSEPINIGSSEMVSINELADLTMEIAGKKLGLRHVPGPLGVRGRSSDNRLIERALGWRPSKPLREGLVTTYAWIESQVSAFSESRASAVGAC
jgi:nucleoside-diphosphate-sugar epimerase